VTLNDRGIVLDGGASFNTIDGNTALNNRDIDLEDDNPGCGGNSWFSNTFRIANQGCIS
jgi:hypothetical protein